MKRAPTTRKSQSRHGAPRLTRAECDRRRAAARQWRIDNKPYFDALYGPEPTDQAQVLADRCAAARQWRIDNKPYFDALYGPQTCPRCAQPQVPA